MNTYVANRIAQAVMVCMMLAKGTHLWAQEPSLPESVRVALVQYMHLEPLAVTVSQTAEVGEAGQQKLAKELMERTIAAHTNVQQIAFRDGRLYVRRERMIKGNAASYTTPEIFEFAFDRSVLYMGRPHKISKTPMDSPMLHKILPKNDHPDGSYASLEYMHAAGIRLPTRVKDLVGAWHPQSEILALLAEGGQVQMTGSAKVEGRSLVRVQLTAKDLTLQGTKEDLSKLERTVRLREGITEEGVQRELTTARRRGERSAPLRRHDFYLDPERGYAVRRLEITDEAGRLLMRSDCTDHEHLTGRTVWLPRRCRMEVYCIGEMLDEETMMPRAFGSPLYVNHFEVSKLDLQPWPDERFELNYTMPGTQVNDGTLPEVKGRSGVRYTIPANSNELDTVVEEARRKYQRSVDAGRWSPTVRLMFLIFNVLLLVGFAAYYVVRRRKARSA
jgi:hypothetical protein